MRGAVEADETFVLESFKGQRKVLALAQWTSRRRGGKARKRGLWGEQIPILVLLARTAPTADFVLPTARDKGVDEGAVKAVMASPVANDAVLCTDGSGLLASAARALDIEHQPVNLAGSERSTAEGPVLKTPHGCPRWQSRSEGVIGQREQGEEYKG